MKVLITGRAGFIGSHVAEYHAKRRHKVIVLDNLSRSRLVGYYGKNVEYSWQYLSSFKNINRVKSDIRIKKM